MNKTRRLPALVLALAVLLGALPLSAAATGAPATPQGRWVGTQITWKPVEDAVYYIVILSEQAPEHASAVIMDTYVAVSGTSVTKVHERDTNHGPKSCTYDEKLGFVMDVSNRVQYPDDKYKFFIYAHSDDKSSEPYESERISGSNLWDGWATHAADYNVTLVDGEVLLSGKYVAAAQAGYLERLKIRAVTKSGAKFLRWESSAGGTFADENAAETYFFMPAGDTTLTAVCLAPCTVTFNPMGGQVEPISATTGADGRLAAFPTPTKEGYKFTGWYSGPGGDTIVPKDTVFLQNTMVFAHWKAESSEEEPQPENPFEDVPEGKYYTDAVLWAVSQEPQITAGTDATHFSPGKECTRGQVVRFLWNYFGQPEPGITEHPFTDVKADAYYYKAMLWAVEEGITKGTTDTTFGPGQPCTRGQVATFLWNAAGKPEPGLTAHPFTDVKEGAYYYKAMLWALENGITKGTTDTTFGPGQTCTRGQVVTFLYNADKAGVYGA